MEALRSSRRAWPKRSYTALNCIDVKPPCLLQFALSKSFYSHAEGEYLEVVWVYNNRLHISQSEAELSAHGMHSGRGLGAH